MVECLNISHTVRLYPMGGEQEMDTMTVTYGSTYGKLQEPVKEGAIFVGWYTSPITRGGGKDIQIKSDSMVTAWGREKLYAQWGIKIPCGDNLTWDIREGVLTVSGMGEMNF